jgi:hypothetical protein
VPFLFALLFSFRFAGGAQAAKEPPAETDAFTVTAPKKPWVRPVQIDPPGQLSWLIGNPKVDAWQIRIAFDAVAPTEPRAAINALLTRERRLIRADVDENDKLSRGEFEPDSMAVGGLKWYGFRVALATPGRTGVSYRWIALHPDFPKRRRAFVLAFDEGGPKGRSVASRVKDARAVAASLVPHGVGLAGGIESAYLDARVATFAARIDSATKLCWSDRGPDASPLRNKLGIGIGMAIDGDFHEVSDIVPRDSLIDAAAAEYGTMFDRNGDGQPDVLVLNRGITPARGPIVLPAVVVLADDNFDGRVDSSVQENGDADGDGKADHRLLVIDSNHDGKPDRAVRFTDSIAQGTSQKSWIEGELVVDQIVGNPNTRLDFEVPWRGADREIEELGRARALCKGAQVR